MKRLTIAIVLAFLSACSQSASQSASSGESGTANRGEQAVAEFLKRDASPYRKDKARITVNEEGERAVVYELDIWRRQTDTTTTTLSLISKPAEDAGTGSLAIEEKGKPTVNVTYAASRDEFRETDTNKMFFGGLTVQELLGEWNKYSYKLTGEANGIEVEGKLKNGEKSVIAANKIRFDTASYLPVEVRLYDASGKEIRIYQNAEIKTVAGHHSYIAKAEVTNPVYNSKIVIEILSREFPDKLDDQIFTRDRLKTAAK